MSNLSKPKKIAIILVIVIVLLVPVIMAFNDQGVQEALFAFGAQGPSLSEMQTTGNAKYNHSAPANGLGADAGPEATALPAQTAKPIGGADVIESVKAEPAPTPEPTPTPKWAPRYIATDGELLADGLVEEDSVNVLIMGVDTTAYAFDTIGVVSISKDKQTVRLIMFSRDLYIGYSDEVVARIKKIKHDKLPGEYKINNTYNVARNTEKHSEGIAYNDNRFGNYAYDFLAQVVYEKFDIWVDDFVRLNTYGLVRLVDTFGGVRVNVPVAMRYHDPDQNLNINIAKGTQVLNGSQAEGFVRFRQGYNSRGELTVTADRTQNQIAFMKAFYEQHARIANIGKIPDVISTLRKNIVHSISADELFTKYVDILTAVTRESYDFETVNFKYKSRRIGGAVHDTIQKVYMPGDAIEE